MPSTRIKWLAGAERPRRTRKLFYCKVADLSKEIALQKKKKEKKYPDSFTVDAQNREKGLLSAVLPLSMEAPSRGRGSHYENASKANIFLS